MNSSVKHRQKLLFIVSRFPYPLEKGDKLRAYYQLVELSKNYNVTLIAFSDKPVSQEQIVHVKPFCTDLYIYRLNWWSKVLNIARCFFNDLPFQVGYFYNFKAHINIKRLIKEKDFNHIYNQLIRTTEYTKNVHHIPKTLDYMDALSEGIRKRSIREPWYRRWIFRMEAKRLLKYERHVFDFFENKIIISEQDRELISHPNNIEISCVPNGISAHFFEYIPPTNEFDFVFVGNMSYAPNIDVVHYIINEILPVFPNSKLLVSGATPHTSILKAAAQSKNIEVTGWVDDIRLSYRRGKLFLAPMLLGTGMQNKLLEAMALKTPCITTPLTNNAIGAENNKHILVASSKEEIINGIRLLLDNQALRDALASEAYSFVKKQFSWDSSTAQLLAIMDNRKGH